MIRRYVHIQAHWKLGGRFESNSVPFFLHGTVRQQEDPEVEVHGGQSSWYRAKWKIVSASGGFWGSTSFIEAAAVLDWAQCSVFLSRELTVPFGWIG